MEKKSLQKKQFSWGDQWYYGILMDYGVFFE